MPYVITTTRTVEQRAGSNDFGQSVEQVTRRAVDTVGDANAAIRLICDPTGGRAVWTHPAIYWRSITDGGRIPLPDGTVIDVERVTIERVLGALPKHLRMAHAHDLPREIIAAYNAAQASA